MTSTKDDQRGFSAIETALVVVIVALIGFVGWYVYHSKQKSDDALNAAASTSQNASPAFKKSTKAAGSTSTTSSSASTSSLQTDLNSATSSSNAGSQDLSNTNNSLNDQSTLTTVPQ